MNLRLKIRLIGMLILVLGFAIIRFTGKDEHSVNIPEIEAVPQLKPEYTVNIAVEATQ